MDELHLFRIICNMKRYPIGIKNYVKYNIIISYTCKRYDEWFDESIDFKQQIRQCSCKNDI